MLLISDPSCGMQIIFHVASQNLNNSFILIYLKILKILKHINRLQNSKQISTADQILPLFLPLPCYILKGGATFFSFQKFGRCPINLPVGCGHLIHLPLSCYHPQFLHIFLLVRTKEQTEKVWEKNREYKEEVTLKSTFEYTSNFIDLFDWNSDLI